VLAHHTFLSHSLQVTLTVIDKHGNAATCAVGTAVPVVDDINPAITCPSDRTVNVAARRHHQGTV
jgi:hypothetical protein